MITLKNKDVSLVISEHGAEPCSLESRQTGIQYIWSGDPAYWKRHAPILFPMAGPTKDGQISVGGKLYDMPNNGFARDSEFKLVHSDSNAAEFVLEDSPETRAVYPFGFKLTIDYKIEAAGFSVKATVLSKTDGMHFTYALHPAFMLAMNQGSSMEDCMVRFYEAEHQDKDSLQNKVFVTEKDGMKGKILQLSRAELDKGPIVLHSVKSNRVTFCSSKGKHGVEISMGAMHTLVCWSPEGKNAPFVCVEPMHSFGDSTRSKELSEMKETIALNKGQSKAFLNEFRIF